MIEATNGRGRTARQHRKHNGMLLNKYEAVTVNNDSIQILNFADCRCAIAADSIFRKINFLVLS